MRASKSATSRSCSLVRVLRGPSLRLLAPFGPAYRPPPRASPGPSAFACAPLRLFVHPSGRRLRLTLMCAASMIHRRSPSRFLARIAIITHHITLSPMSPSGLREASARKSQARQTRIYRKPQADASRDYAHAHARCARPASPGNQRRGVGDTGGQAREAWADGALGDYAAAAVLMWTAAAGMVMPGLPANHAPPCCPADFIGATTCAMCIRRRTRAANHARQLASPLAVHPRPAARLQLTVSAPGEPAQAPPVPRAVVARVFSSCLACAVRCPATDARNRWCRRQLRRLPRPSRISSHFLAFARAALPGSWSHARRPASTPLIPPMAKSPTH